MAQRLTEITDNISTDLQFKREAKLCSKFAHLCNFGWNRTRSFTELFMIPNEIKSI